MDKYLPHDIEQRWYREWERCNYFAPSGHGTPFSIAIPPPNVTGTLHLGHAFQHSLVDALIRYQRMKGKDTLWQMGTDHAGIATQMIVTEQLAAEGIKPVDIGREAFLERVWGWKEESGSSITQQLRRLGASLHWGSERFTLDEGLSRAVLEVFVRLFDEGLIYRGKRLVNWDPVLRTSISDLEVISEEEQGHLWYLRYPIACNPENHVIVATTRPETMLGDTAVAVHPDDSRYKDLIGQEIILPLTGRSIPVIADRHVDKTFGSGCVKITPAHDFNDYDMGRRHDLPVINIFNDDATINDNAPVQYRGMDRYVARKAIVDDLENQNLLEKTESHKMAVPRGERSGVVVEPWLSDQWFVKIKPLAETAIKAVEDGDIKFIPKNYENTYFVWMRNIQDWNISRQQWWGHRIPAWYDPDGRVYVGRSEEEVRSRHQLSEDISLSQDEDVLDTWFSSALWTFSTLGWPDKTPEMETFHPTNVMVTGHDIITIWVSKMIMMTLKFIGEVPFREVYVTGIVTDVDGRKQSKSKGNGLDPLDIIDGISLDDLITKRTENLMQPRMAERIARDTKKEFPEGIKPFGSDALRFTFYSIATSARSMRFDMKRVEGYGNFCNKLWNAAKYVFLNTRDYNPDDELTTDVIDCWIVTELHKTIRAVNLAMDTYRFDLASRAVYEFIRDEFCDWYVELTKPVLNSTNISQARIAAKRFTLLRVLEETLRLAHPFLPFITEEIWQQIPRQIRGEGVTIMLQSFPSCDRNLIDAAAIDEMRWVKDVVTGTRNIRGEMNISPGTPIPILLFNGCDLDHSLLEKHRMLLEFLIKPKGIDWLLPDADKPPASTHLVGEMQLLVPLEGLIDKEAEISRLDKEIERRQKDHKRTAGKLGNQGFLANAPEDVVQKEKEKMVDIMAALEKLQEQRNVIERL